MERARNRPRLSLQPPAWSKGYGTEAAIAVLAYGLGPVGLKCIMAVVVPENVGSWRVM
jgi:ribosomal-protein-alanine N-acetyltransferase